MTNRETLDRAQAVLVVGIDENSLFVFLDPAWVVVDAKVETAIEQVSKYRRSYSGCIVLTATELRELADSLNEDTPQTVTAALLDTAASYENLLCDECFEELASECTICSQLRREAAREIGQ